jgi:hypothetical protein
MELTKAPDLPAEHISTDRCRDLLGDEALGLSDDDIDQMRRHAETMAQVLIEMFLQDRSTLE